MSEGINEEVDEVNKRLQLLTTTDSDFKFILTDDDYKEVPAHKHKIASASPELKNMIFGLDTKNDTPLNQLEVDGISYDAFMEIISYIYDDCFSFNKEYVYEVLTKSNYFGIVELEKLCIAAVTMSLDENNVCLAFAYFSSLFGYSYPDMLKFCQKELEFYGIKALRTDAFLEIPLDVLRKIVLLDVIQCPEIDLFEQAIRWAENQCVKQSISPRTENKRKMLKGVDRLFRFNTLTLSEFYACIALDIDFYKLDEILTIQKEIIAGTSRLTKRLFGIDKGNFVLNKCLIDSNRMFNKPCDVNFLVNK